MSLSWRDRARLVIVQVLRANEGQPDDVIKKALFDAYPFGERRYTPYKTWLNEIRRQRGLIPTPKIGGRKKHLPPEGQESLFERKQ